MGSSEPFIDEKVNILLVDDRPENLIALNAILENPGYRLITATSGPEALGQLLRNDFAVILLDIMMPGMDGYEVASIIRARERTRSIPIIFLTAQAKDFTHIYKAYSVGAVDFLTKPLETEVVKAKVSVFVELFKNKEEIKRQANLLRESERREQEYRLENLKRLSEKRYRELANAIPQIVWTATPRGEISYLNQQWVKYTKTTPNLSENPHVLEPVLHRDDAASFFTLWEKTIQTEDHFEIECRLKKYDGTYRWHLCRAVPEKDAEVRTMAWLGTFTDIDDNKKAEEERTKLLSRAEFLAEASKLVAVTLDYSTTLANIACLAVPKLSDWCTIHIADEDGVIRRLESVYSGYSQKDLLKKFFEGHPIHEKNSHPIIGVLKSGQSLLINDFSDLILKSFSHDDQQFEELKRLNVQSAMLVPMIARGRSVGAITMISTGSSNKYDSSDLETAEELARRAASAIDNARLYRSAQEAIQVRDEFLSIASHELRTPITPLNLQLQQFKRMAQRGELTSMPAEALKKMLETYERQVARLTHLIEELLSVSRINIGRLTIDAQEVDLEQLVLKVVDHFRQELGDVDCSIVTKGASPIIGQWDRLRIEEVVINLLSNALKFGSKKPIEIEISKSSENSRAMLKVQDHGIGIEKEDQLRIFDCFERAVSARHYGGLGLGLYIVSQIIKAHGGSIHVESSVGEGATFTVDLPLTAIQIKERAA